MSRIKIETLTSVHIGSGETLQYGTDFVPVKVQNGHAYIGIMDPRRILDLIGEEHISQWVAAIERNESSSSIVKLFAPNARVKDYSKRTILNWTDGVKSTDTLKEHIHDGMGFPYIPGSSIKGAIRTAVLSQLASKVNNANEKIIVTNRDGSKQRDRNGNFKLSANAIECELFGKDPNSDVFRFLQVGDAIFGKNYEVAVKMVNINERIKQSFWDTSKPQLIEAIGPEDSSEFQLKLLPEFYKFAKGHWAYKNSLGKLPVEMESISSLFTLINIHTKELIESEIAYWQDLVNDDDTESVSNYIEKMETILKSVGSCKEGTECVLRIGHGSGWRFITGAWTENFENFSSLVVPVSRPKNFNYEQYDFPKTRRVDDQCELLGFVKLSIKE